MTRKFIAELLGTAILVYVGCGVATLMFGFNLAEGFGAGVVVTALAFGLVLVGLAYAFGNVSGTHVNPAVTLGALLAGRIKGTDALVYWVAQFVGGFLGALALWGTFAASPFYSRTRTGLGTNGWGVGVSHIGIAWWGAAIFEVLLTAVFVYVILVVTSKVGSPIVAGLIIGLTLGMVHLLGIMIDGTSVNPARSLGPALIVGGTALKQVWLFIVAPLTGAAVAALVFRLMHPVDADADADVDAVPASV